MKIKVQSAVVRWLHTRPNHLFLFNLKRKWKIYEKGRETNRNALLFTLTFTKQGHLVLITSLRKYECFCDDALRELWGLRIPPNWAKKHVTSAQCQDIQVCSFPGTEWRNHKLQRFSWFVHHEYVNSKLEAVSFIIKKNTSWNWSPQLFCTKVLRTQATSNLPRTISTSLN